MQTISRTFSTATLITGLVLGTTLPAAAGDAAWSEVTDPAAVFVASLDVPQRLDGALERLATRAQPASAYVGAAERLAGRLPSSGEIVAAAATTRCGDADPLLAE